MWCSSSRLEAACDGRVGRHILVRTFGQMCPQQQENARCLVPSAYRAVFDKLIAERARCGGWDGTTCIFAQTAAGGPANLQKQRAACLFCDPPRLSETCSTVTGRGRVLACIRRMATTSRDAAVARVPEDHRGFFVGALAEIPGTALGARRANRSAPPWLWTGMPRSPGDDTIAHRLRQHSTLFTESRFWTTVPEPGVASAFLAAPHAVQLW